MKIKMFEDMTKEELITECRNLFHISYELAWSLKTGILPSVQAYKLLEPAAMNSGDDEFWKRGKKLQDSLGWEKVPTKTEIECSAGLWDVLQEATAKHFNRGSKS